MSDSQQFTGAVQAKHPGVKNLTNAGKGRVAGVPNKTTTILKDMILQALDGAGGVEYLQRQADENPGPFLTLVGKVLPLQVVGDSKNPIRIEIVRYSEDTKRLAAPVISATAMELP
ncbi:MAG TPA: hypothetical protein PLI96_08035 [Halothiobacillus sp.]|nr:hypothetical protein [Halothiobacillus sp.]